MNDYGTDTFTLPRSLLTHALPARVTGQLDRGKSALHETSEGAVAVTVGAVGVGYMEIRVYGSWAARIDFTQMLVDVANMLGAPMRAHG